MQAVSGGIVHTPDEGLGAILRPLSLVVERARVEHDLVHDLRDLDGVGARARSAGLERAGGRVRDVRLVVRGVEVLAVPACREVHRHSPAAAAGLRREGLRVLPRAGGPAERVLLHVRLAAVAQALLHRAGGAVRRVSDEHSEALIKCKNSQLEASFPVGGWYLPEGKP